MRINIMRGSSLVSVLLILCCAACIDPVFIDVGRAAIFPIIIDGYISNQPGPYTIQITKAFDIESNYSIKTSIQAKQLVLSDNQGNSEILSPVDQGVYQTDPAGIRGTVGRVYKLRIELLDGRIYETKPDTLLPSGKVDSIYFSFRKDISDKFLPLNGSDKYSFDIRFNSSAGSKTNYHFLWKFTGTFQSDTNPELDFQEPCGFAACDSCSVCNYLPLCSGIRNFSRFPDLPRAHFVRVAPCTCCTCWYNIFNTTPLVSDGQLVRDGRFNSVLIYNLPLNQWIFQHKIYAEIKQMSLSRQAFDFWRAVKDQKQATNSLFQPVTGSIPSNFVQISGPQAPAQGLFYATSITSKAIFITREDVPDQNIIPPADPPWANSCLTLFPNGTTTKPSYWKD